MQEKPHTHNPFLTANAGRTPSGEGGNGHIEHPDDQYYNMAWQTRPRAPTAYEMDLSRALESIFTTGATTLKEIVDGLNKANIPPPNGGVWTEDIFTETMAALSALPDNAETATTVAGAGIVPRN